MFVIFFIKFLKENNFIGTLLKKIKNIYIRADFLNTFSPFLRGYIYIF